MGRTKRKEKGLGEGEGDDYGGELGGWIQRLKREGHGRKRWGLVEGGE